MAGLLTDVYCNILVWYAVAGNIEGWTNSSLVQFYRGPVPVCKNICIELDNCRLVHTCSTVFARLNELPQ